MNRKQRRVEARRGQRGERSAGSPAAPIAQWFSAALAHQRGERAAEAERICRRILSLEPGHAQTLHLLGLLEHQRGRSDDAIEHIRTAIMRDGRDPAFHHNLGNILRGLDRPAEAFSYYERALGLAPTSVDTLYNLGNICQDLGRPERAATYFERALRLNPEAVELHNNLGSVFQDLGRLDEATDCYRKALALRPDLVETLDNLAGALQAQGKLDEAQACYNRALELRPNRAESRIGLGVVLRAQGRLEDAVASYRQALALSPEHPDAHNNLGVALLDLGRREEAITHHEKALALQPGRAELHYNLGNALQHHGLYSEALACYGRALALNPAYAKAHLNRSLALLLNGEFDEGWQEYEWRFAVNVYDRKFDQPLWSGEPLAGARILIHAEQGFGDTLQFVRYTPAVAELGGRVVLEVPQSLVRLARTVTGASEVVAAGDSLPAFDCHCPLLSLPRVIKTNLTTIPNAVPYLRVPAEASAGWAERIPATPRPRVGVAWAGTTVGAIDLQLLQPLWEVDGVSWFSIQVGERSGDIASLDCVKITDLSPWLTDFAETAAAVCRLDLVISVDTSVAHLAGALGRPIWLLLRHPPEWRWLLERE
ncbi:MAG: tetratricopeptide repeat-containing glycosyltransferase family protein, partial [Stellaceae bacterium]